MKKLLLLAATLLTSLLSTTVSANELKGDYTLVKTYGNVLEGKSTIYQGNVSGRCYLDGYRILSEVDCRDHGILSKPIPQKDEPTPLDNFIESDCTKPRKGVDGKSYITCEIQEDYLEKLEYKRLKDKFGEIK